MLIAIEGMDGSGKTTLAKRLATSLNFEFVELPNKALFDMNKEEYNILCQKLYDFNDERVTAWFFGMGNLVTALQKNKDLIVDRHFLSNYFWNGTSETEEIFNVLLNASGMPDLTIILYANAETRLRRIYGRDPNDKDLYDPKKMAFGYDKMLHLANEQQMPYVIIDTERYSEEVVFGICDSIVKTVSQKTKSEIYEYCYDVNNAMSPIHQQPCSRHQQSYLKTQHGKGSEGFVSGW